MTLLKRGTMYIGWNSCKIDERISITKCYKYQGYGHVASKCNNKTACGFCAKDHAQIKKILKSTGVSYALTLRRMQNISLETTNVIHINANWKPTSPI